METRTYVEEILLRFTHAGLQGAHKVTRTEILLDGEIVGRKDAITAVTADDLNAVLCDEASALIGQAVDLSDRLAATQTALASAGEEIAALRVQLQGLGALAASRDRENAALQAALQAMRAPQK